MRDFLRFILSAADSARIDPTSIQIDEVTAAPGTDDDPPLQSLRLRFTVKDPSSGAPKLIPLIPGKVIFSAAAAASGVSPEPGDVELTSAKYATWKTEGRLSLNIEDKTVIMDLANHVGSLEVLPNRVWYAPVKITEDFLFNSLAGSTGLKRSIVHDGTTSVSTTSANWPNSTISGFLKGTYRTEFRLGADATSDDVAIVSLPTVVMATDGTVELFITVGTQETPTDGKQTEFDAITPTSAAASPLHASYGLVPARHVYRLCRAHMLDAPAGNSFADAVLVDWPAARRFATIQFTRTWLRTLSSGEVVKNYSIHFPKQTVRVSNADGSTRLEMSLAAHGVCFVPVEPEESASAAINVTVEVVAGGMRWLDGATADSWKVAAGTTAIATDLVASPTTHIVVRLPMSDAVLVEERDTPKGSHLCTYMSLRRSVRALVDNRIAGGRLNFDRSHTSTPVQKLISQAWDETGVPSADRHNATVSIVKNGFPLSATTNINSDSGALERVLVAFFPDKFQAADPANNPPTALKGGEIFYDLWQTIISVLSATATRDNFSDDDVGRGSPGSLVALGLSTGYAVNTDQGAAESDDDFRHRIVTEMCANLEPGAVLQFWDTVNDHNLVRQRQSPVGGGHSPMFLRYMTDATGVIGITVIDQFGEVDCQITGAPADPRLKWHTEWGWTCEVWNGANWAE